MTRMRKDFLKFKELFYLLAFGSNIGRNSLLKKEGGRGLAGADDSVKKETKSFYASLRNSDERMLQAALSEMVISENGKMFLEFQYEA